MHARQVCTIEPHLQPLCCLRQGLKQYGARADQELSMKARLALNWKPCALGFEGWDYPCVHCACLAFSFFSSDDRFVHLTHIP